MGASKRLAEMVLQARAANGSGKRTVFTMVRFGNVLDSSGSVVRMFRRQIEAGGPVTVTHPEMIRYFMSIPEAAALVIQAGAMATGGDVFVLDMGEPVKIDDLAKSMIRLMGLEVRDEQHPDGDIAIEYIGLRHGEKLYEELLLGENITPTEHPRILKSHEPCMPAGELAKVMERCARPWTPTTCRPSMPRSCAPWKAIARSCATCPEATPPTARDRLRPAPPEPNKTTTPEQRCGEQLGPRNTYWVFDSAFVKPGKWQALATALLRQSTGRGAGARGLPVIGR